MRLGAHPLVVAVALGLLGPEALAAPATRPARRVLRPETILPASAPHGRAAASVEADVHAPTPEWDALLEIADDLRAISATA